MFERYKCQPISNHPDLKLWLEPDLNSKELVDELPTHQTTCDANDWRQFPPGILFNAKKLKRNIAVAERSPVDGGYYITYSLV